MADASVSTNDVQGNKQFSNKQLKGYFLNIVHKNISSRA